MLERIAVGDIMTRNPVSVSPSDSLIDCAKTMIKHDVGSVLVTHKGKLLGIITQKDLLARAMKRSRRDLKSTKAVDICTRKTAVVKPSAALTEAFEKMRYYGFRRLPVIANGIVVGMLTLKDLLAVDPNLYTRAGELRDLREESEKMRRTSELEDVPIEGLCEECGALSDLIKVENKLLCPDCRNELY